MRFPVNGRLFGLLLTLVVLSTSTTSLAFCLVGQEWPGFDSEWSEPGTITGDGQTFLALVDPHGGCDCPIGLQSATIDYFMTIAEDTPLPLTISVSLGVREAIPQDGSPLPWLPGATLCESPVRDFSIEIPKDIVGFGTAVECPCLAMEAPFFLFFTIHSTLDPAGGLYTDGHGSPAPGHFLTFAGGEWVDLAAAGILTRGDLVISSFAECCETPVAAARSSWSEIKSIFR